MSSATRRGFTIVGSSSGRPTIWTSPDGSGWTATTLGDSAGELRSVATHGGLAVAVGSQSSGGSAGRADLAGAAWHTTDGAWELATILGATAPGELTEVTWTGREFLAIDGSSVYGSTDGVVWRRVSTGLPSGATRLAADGGSILAAGLDGGTPAIWTSPDGVAWSAARLPPGATGRVAAVASHGGSLVAVGSSPSGVAAWYSTDGSTWLSGGPIEDGERRPDARPGVGRQRRRRGRVARSAGGGLERAGRLALKPWPRHGRSIRVGRMMGPDESAPSRQDRPNGTAGGSSGLGLTDAGPITGQAAGGAPALVPEPPLTFLFTDVESSTRLWEQNPLAMRSALAQHDSIVRSAIADSGGEVVKTTGDGLMAVFAAPVAAVTASIAAQRGLIAAKWPQACAIRIRIGIHTGEAESRGGDYFGPDRQPDGADHVGRSRQPGPAVGRDRGARRRPAAGRRHAARSG